MSVERVREAKSRARSLPATGFCRTTIYKWLNTVKGRGRGLAALRSRKGTGRPGKVDNGARTAGLSLMAQTGQSDAINPA